MDFDYRQHIYTLPFINLDEIWGKKPYVYFMFSHDGEKLWYVGQTKNLRNRVHQHEKTAGELAFLLHDSSLRCVKFKAIEVPEDKLLEVEKYYIQTYKPLRNIDHNSPDVIQAYNIWFTEKLLIADNYYRELHGEKPLTYEEAFGDEYKFLFTA